MSEVKRVLATMRLLRKKYKYSLEQVGTGIGYETGKGYYDLERGKTEIKLEHLVKLAEFYKVSLKFFLSDDSTVLVQGGINCTSDPKPAA